MCHSYIIWWIYKIAMNIKKANSQNVPIVLLCIFILFHLKIWTQYQNMQIVVYWAHLFIGDCHIYIYTHTHWKQPLKKLLVAIMRYLILINEDYQIVWANCFQKNPQSFCKISIFKDKENKTLMEDTLQWRIERFRDSAVH